MLPQLQIGLLNHERVMIELRVMQTTAKAVRVAEPFSGPDTVAGKTAWLPRSRVTVGNSTTYHVHLITLPVWLYSKLRQELA